MGACLLKKLKHTEQTLSHLHVESKKVKQSESRLIDIENKRVIARMEQVERWMKWMKRIKNLKFQLYSK